MKSQRLLASGRWKEVLGFNISLTMKNISNIVKLTANIVIFSFTILPTPNTPDEVFYFAWKRILNNGASQFVGHNILASGNQIGASWAMKMPKNHLHTSTGIIFDKPNSNHQTISYQLYMYGSNITGFQINSEVGQNPSLFTSNIIIEEMQGDIEYTYDSNKQETYIEII